MNKSDLTEVKIAVRESEDAWNRLYSGCDSSSLMAAENGRSMNCQVDMNISIRSELKAIRLLLINLLGVARPGDYMR